MNPKKVNVKRNPVKKLTWEANLKHLHLLDSKLFNEIELFIVNSNLDNKQKIHLVNLFTKICFTTHT